MSTMAPEPLDKRRALRIRGGTPLRGEVTIGGAKNAALPLLAATLLTSEPCVLNNVPTLSDIRTMTQLLAALGAEVDYDPSRHRVTMQAGYHHHHRRTAGAGRQNACLLPGRRSASGSYGKDDRVYPGRVPAWRAPGRCRCPRFSADGRHHRSRRAVHLGRHQEPGAAWRVDLHGLSEPYRHRKPADGRHAGDWTHDDCECILRAGNRRAWQHAQPNGRSNQRTRFAHPRGRGCRSAARRVGDDSCPIGSKPVPMPSPPQ